MIFGRGGVKRGEGDGVLEVYCVSLDPTDLEGLEGVRGSAEKRLRVLVRLFLLFGGLGVSSMCLAGTKSEGIPS